MALKGAVGNAVGGLDRGGPSAGPPLRHSLIELMQSTDHSLTASAWDQAMVSPAVASDVDSTEVSCQLHPYSDQFSCSDLPVWWGLGRLRQLRPPFYGPNRASFDSDRIRLGTTGIHRFGRRIWNAQDIKPHEDERWLPKTLGPIRPVYTRWILLAIINQWRPRSQLSNLGRP